VYLQGGRVIVSLASVELYLDLYGVDRAHTGGSPTARCPGEIVYGAPKIVNREMTDMCRYTAGLGHGVDQGPPRNPRLPVLELILRLAIWNMLPNGRGARAPRRARHASRSAKRPPR